MNILSRPTESITARSLPLALVLVTIMAASARSQEPRTAAPADPTSRKTQQERKPNRLIHEKSPYLRQHAYNPVDWWPWCDEAFAEAKRRGVPVFVSIGYSTCHWCHVMERESFEDEEIADYLNRHFVCIKVDREERPDIDAVCQKYIQLTAPRGSGGGWPASIFMSPDRKPFFSGTYFPREPRFGRPGFKQILEQLVAFWEKDKDKIAAFGDQIDAILKRRSDPAKELPKASFAIDAARGLAAWHDPVHGGFPLPNQPAPKFPRTSVHELLFTAARATADAALAEPALHSLRKMAAGGIRDHVGGGFHRYSTDERWLVPHFEKMLYDQALIAATYLDAWRQSGDDAFLDVAHDTLDCIVRDFGAPRGGFYSAFDADSGGEEGTFYLWSRKELEEVLPKRLFAVVMHRFDVTEEGNWDEHPGRCILAAKNDWETVAKDLDMTLPEVRAAWESARRLLRERRMHRPRPARDDKIITGWNALAISAFARSALFTGRRSDLEHAVAAARFILEKLRDADGNLLRRYCAGEAAHEAVLADHAYLARALIDLFAASGDPAWLEAALDVADRLRKRFEDAEHGGFYDFATAELRARTKDPYDGARPSGNSAAIDALLRLADVCGRDDFFASATRAIRAFTPEVRERPSAYPAFLTNLIAANEGFREIVIVGDRSKPATRALLDCVARHPSAAEIVLLLTDDQVRKSAKLAPVVEQKSSSDGDGVAYVCRAGACKLPAYTAKDLLDRLQSEPRTAK